MQDIIPPQKRKSIRDIPLPSNKNKIVREEEPVRIQKIHEKSFIQDEPVEEEIEDEYFEPQKPVRSNRSNRSRRGGKKRLVAISAAAIVLILLAVFFSRSGAKVFVYAKELSQSSNATISVPFTEEELVLERSVSIKATGEEEVKEKAKGQITIYNEYEETEQRLLKDTRFESVDGKIYRIPSSVVVPGTTRDEKGNVIPGKLDVEVVADEVGEEYNIPAGRFTVPGFEGLPQFESFYAISTHSIEGGFDGVRKVISESDRQEAETTLKQQLRDALLTEVRDRSSDEKLVLADESMILYEILSDKVSGENVSISARGTIKATAFNSQDFNNEIAKSVIPQFSISENVLIENLDDLNVSVSKSDENTATIEVSGTIDFVWQNDHDSLKQAIAGTEKDSIRETVEMFPGITKITSEIRPLWKNTFPEDVSKIEIIDSRD